MTTGPAAPVRPGGVPEAGRAAPGRRRRGRRRPAPGWCRRRRAPRWPPAARPASSDASSAPQVPTRSSVRAPRSASSAITIAALGPPMPVLWMVSGRAVGGLAGVAPQAAVVVEHLRLGRAATGPAAAPGRGRRGAAPARPAARSAGGGSCRARRAAAYEGCAAAAIHSAARGGVQVIQGVPRGHGPHVRADERRPGHGPQAARRRHPAAVRVHRPRPGGQHPRRRGRTSRTWPGSGPTTSTGSRRCG